MSIANALTLVYDLLKSEVNDVTKYELIKSWDMVFSLDLVKERKIDDELKMYIQQKIEERTQAKKNKDYQKADSIREELFSKGVLLKDGREGTSYELI